jgi:protocatechuate 3,4-dioxygenase, alpha subunit
MQLVPTASQTVGPFFHLGCTRTHSVSCLATQQAKGERVWLTCRVLDGDSVPVSDAMLELWQANAEGKYIHPDDPQDKPADPHCSGFGRLASDEQGSSVFETVRPGAVPGPDGTMQAPHINVSVFARGIQKRLATRIYFFGDPANVNDAVLALVPEERRATLMAQPDPQNVGSWNFTIRLCGENETVFFDV